MFKIITGIFFSVVSLNAYSQRVSAEEYVAQFKQTAINEMKRTGVPAAITLAQGILESENGNSELVKKSNNHFGIKCKSTWSGETVTHDDDATGECFRAYANAAESYRDHSDFLKFNKRYGSLFSLDPEDYTAWAKGLKKAGYATNPRYPDLLIKYIEQYNLQQYSLEALNKLPDSDIAKTDAENAGLTDETFNKLPVSGNDQIVLISGSADLTSINDIKCVYAKKGTSLLVIANQYNIGLSKLMEFNDMTEEGILEKDQYVFLHKKSKTGNRQFYIVQAGETLFEIAQLNGIQLKYLLEYNYLSSSSVLKPNMKLLLQPGLKNTDNQIVAKNNNIHLVAPKEGLYAIARAYKVTVQQLKEWNKLDSEELRIGQEIIISK